MEIPVSTIQKFNSTSYSPFHMQFRRYILSRNLTIGDISIVESILLRNGTFAVEGLLVDMTESPGIGLRNHTVPQVSHGGVWSEDILWLEPQTSCVNTNITIDFSLDIDAQAIGTINITDHGGFSNLPPENNVNIATSDHNIDHPGAVNLAYRAYKTAVMINRVALQSLPAMNPPEFGKTVVIGRFEDHPFIHDRMHVLGLSAYVNTTARDAATQEIEAWCRGYNINGSTNASINTPSIHCQVFLSAPIPHKDPSLLMSQYLTVCASSVRASVQRVEFSFNETGALNNIQIQGRKRSNSTIWGVENTTMTMRDVNLFWGAVSSRYENDTSLSTIRSETLYLPAGQSDFTLSSSNDSPSSIPSAIWNRLYSPVTLSGYDFAGVGRFNLQMKWRSFLHKDIAGGAAITLKQIWTDIAVNNLVGTSVTETASVRPYGPSVTYNFRYSVPFFLLCAIWLPILLLTSVVFIKGRIKPSYIRHILNQTSLGRVVVDDSLLWVVNSGQRSEGGASPSDTGTRTSPRTKSIVSASPTHQVPLRTAVWAITLGKKLVRFGPPSSVLRGSNGNQRDNTTGSPDASVNPRNTSIRVALEYLVRLEKTRDDRGQTSDLS
ncbi:hypothetical protein FRC17_000295 [Serendipita sp. 399]|nr:hypothetical protein FRC17_000295 [Serendipita sp. 399]